jgi:hypothetical protein
MKMADFSGGANAASTACAEELDVGRLAGLYCRLHRERFSGIARIESPACSATLGLRAGRVVSYEDDALGQSFGDALVERGELSSGQYAQVIAGVTEGLVENETLAFCEHAVALGFLSAERVQVELADRMRAHLIQTLAWSHCQVELEQASDAEAEAEGAHPEYPQELGEIVYMGVRTFYDDELLQSYVPDAECSYARLRESAANIGHFFGLDEDEFKLLRRIDPESPLSTLLHASSVERDHALSLLALLRIAQLAEFSSKPFVQPDERSGARLTPTGSRVIENQTQRSQQRIPAVVETTGPMRSSASQSRMQAAIEQTGPSRNASSQQRLPTGPIGATGNQGSQPRIPLADQRNANQGSQPRIPLADQRNANQGSQPRIPLADQRRASAPLGNSSQSALPTAARSAGAVDANPAAIGGGQNATQEALMEAAARAAARRSATSPQQRPVLPQSQRTRSEQVAPAPSAEVPARAKSAPLNMPASESTEASPDPSRADYAKSHLDELIKRRRQQHPDPTAPVKREPARDLRYAQGLLRDGHFARAEEALRALVSQEPENEVLRAYHSWSRLRAQPDADDALIGDLLDLAKRLVQNTDHTAFASYVLGHLYLNAKKDDLAEKYFRRAHAADRTNKDAERHLLILERRKQSAAEADAAANRKIFGIAITGGKPKP